MISHNMQESIISTHPTIVFDELFDGPVTNDCYAVPIASPVSVCTSEESSCIAAAETMSITGKYSDIEIKYFVDPRVLGQGYHGSVRECIDRATGQRFAVKSIRKNDSAVNMGSLAREIMLLQKMKHHSTVQLVDVYEDTEYLHIITDLCEGGELFDKIIEKSSISESKDACFSESEAAKVMYQILTAVSYMHRNDIVHRDIKPENILFESKDKDSPIKVIDFGLSRQYFEGQEPPMNKIVGTPYYIAPEVLRKKYGKSCDLWSVGVIAYILLAGYPPFNGRNNAETHKSVLRGQYSFDSREWSGVSREAQDFIRRLLQKNPRKRMTVEQALNHPWIARHNNIDVALSAEGCKKSPFEEVGIKKALGSTRKGAMLSGRISRRKIKKSIFGI